MHMKLLFHTLTPSARQRRSAVILLVAAACWFVPASIASADAIVVTKAMTASTVVEIFVEESEIRVEMEIGVADLMAFENLLPDQMREQMGLEAAPLNIRLQRFFDEDFVIRADGGNPLPGGGRRDQAPPPRGPG